MKIDNIISSKEPIQINPHQNDVIDRLIHKAVDDLEKMKNGSVYAQVMQVLSLLALGEHQGHKITKKHEQRLHDLIHYHAHKEAEGTGNNAKTIGLGTLQSILYTTAAFGPLVIPGSEAFLNLGKYGGKVVESAKGLVESSKNSEVTTFRHLKTTDETTKHTISDTQRNTKEKIQQFMQKIESIEEAEKRSKNAMTQR